MTGGGIGGRRVGAAVPGSASAVAVHRRIEAEVEPQVARRLPLVDGGREHHVHQDRVRGRVGDVVRDDPVLAARGRARDLAGHAAPVERPDGRGHVPRLEVGERRAVGDDVLQGLDVRVVDRRVVDVAQHAAGDGEPHLRGGVARGAEAVLAREVEVRQHSRPVRGDARGRASGARCACEKHAGRGGKRQNGQPPPWRQAAHSPKALTLHPGPRRAQPRAMKPHRCAHRSSECRPSPRDKSRRQTRVTKVSQTIHKQRTRPGIALPAPQQLLITPLRPRLGETSPVAKQGPFRTTAAPRR